MRVRALGGAFVWIALAATLVVLPMVFAGNVRGHDVDLHLPAWLEAAQQFRQGILYPRWTAGANFGFGEPFFVFYPPLSWMLGGLLSLALPWNVVPGVYVWLMVVLAGLAMWRCAKEWLPDSDAVWAGLLYAINPYLIVMIYKRCNYADLMAAGLAPLVAWAAIRIARGGRAAILPLSVVFAATWISDLPAGVIAAYSVAWLLVLLSLVRRSMRPVVYGGLAIVIAFAGISVFLLPAAWERAWVNIGETLRFEWQPEHNFLFNQDNLPAYVSFNRGLSYMAVLLALGGGLAGLLAHRLRRESSEVWLSFLTIGAISVFMMFSPSVIVWRLLPQMRLVEFPWRWLAPLSVTTVFLTASALSGVRQRWMGWLAVTVLAGGLGAGVIRTAAWNSQHMGELEAASESGSGYRSLAIWTEPAGSHASTLSKVAPLVTAADIDSRELSQQGVEIQVDQWSAERKVFSVTTLRPLRVAVKLLDYPAWEGTVNGRVVPLEAQPGSGQMILPLPAGQSRSEIRFTRTWDRTAGIAVSLVAVIIALLLRRRLRASGPRA